MAAKKKDPFSLTSLEMAEMKQRSSQGQAEDKVTANRRTQDRKAERDALTNAKKNPPKEIATRQLLYTDIEKVVKTALDTYQTHMQQRLAQTKEPVIRTDPTNGTKYQIIGVQLHLKLERFGLTGQELISRFGFDPKVMHPKTIIKAYQLALFKEITIKKLEPKKSEDPDMTLKDSEMPKDGWGDYLPPVDRKIDTLYKDPKMKVVYHAFFPLVKKTETKDIALKELYQGFMNTLLTWGMHHQESMAEEFTQHKVEEDRSVIEAKVKDFNEMLTKLDDE